MERSKEINEKMMIALAILSSVKEVGEAPTGVLYAGLIGKMGLGTFEALIAGLVDQGFLERRPIHCVAITERGKIAADSFDETMKARAGTA